VIVLVLNCGSSSLKYELFDGDSSVCSGLAERVGINGGNDAILTHEYGDEGIVRMSAPMPDHTVAFDYVVDVLTDPEHGQIGSLQEIEAVGHRVVHGGEQFTESVLIDDQVIAAIEDFSELAPLHNPPNLEGIRACRQRLPNVPMVAVFDTAFHQTMPAYAFVYGLPYEMYQDHNIRRYGFHGTSHRYVAIEAGKYLEARGVPLQQQRIVTCHLGNGASVTAVSGGRSLDCSLGFTPLEGLLMGTRSGDLDPAIPLYLIRMRDMDAAEVDQLLNTESGLLGISGAGIGENAPEIRRNCVRGLEFIGLHLDEARNNNVSNDRGVTAISTADSPADILVIPTDEELMIARDTARVVSGMTA